MRIYSVYDDGFREYGKVLDGYDPSELLSRMAEIALPESGTAYEPGVSALEGCGIMEELSLRAYGGMPVQIGLCRGRNTKLGCLEYHRDSEVNIGTHDFILLLAKESDIRDGHISSSSVRAFRVPAGILVEIYATTLHYAPCHTDGSQGFRVAVVLPLGTNLEKPMIAPGNAEDRLLRARNKWLIAHPDSPEARDGAFIGIDGENIDIAPFI